MDIHYIDTATEVRLTQLAVHAFEKRKRLPRGGETLQVVSSDGYRVTATFVVTPLPSFVGADPLGMIELDIKDKEGRPVAGPMQRAEMEKEALRIHIGPRAEIARMAEELLETD